MRKVIFFLIGFALLGWMLWQTGLTQLWHNLLGWNWLLLACIAVWALGYVLNAVSFGLLIGCYAPNPRPGVASVLRLTIGGYALNYITPFGLLGGEPWRIVKLRRCMDQRSANSSVAYYAMMHILSHVLFWCIALVVGLQFVLGSWAGLGLTPAVRIGAVVAVVVLVAALCIAYRVAVRKGWLSSLSQLMHQHPRRFCMALMLELASRLVNVLEFWLLLHALHPDGPLSTYTAAFLVVAISSLVANALFFSPLQMGTREGGILLALQVLLPAVAAPELLSEAVSISLATRIREFFWIFIGLLIISFNNESNHT